MAYAENLCSPRKFFALTFVIPNILIFEEEFPMLTKKQNFLETLKPDGTPFLISKGIQRQNLLDTAAAIVNNHF